jgi:hypothetical protein
MNQSSTSHLGGTERDHYWLKWELSACEHQKSTETTSQTTPRKRHNLKKLTVVTALDEITWLDDSREELSSHYNKDDPDLQVERNRYLHSRTSKDARHIEPSNHHDLMSNTTQLPEDEHGESSLFDQNQHQFDIEPDLQQEESSQSSNKYQASCLSGNLSEGAQEFGAWEVRNDWSIMGNSRPKFKMEESSYGRYQASVITTM